MPNNLKVVSIKLPLSDLRRIHGNRSAFLREAVAEKLVCESQSALEPKTALGRRLPKLRQRFIAEGGELLDSESISKAFRDCRGGLS